MLRYSEIPRNASAKDQVASLRPARKSDATAATFDSSHYDYSFKTRSLPERRADTVVLDPLRVSPDDFAMQLTLLDLPIFLDIRPDELTSCAWNKKNKLIVAPNVVAFTRRFNHVSFWTVQEILSRRTAKQRGEMLGHFIRIARRLYELNNLHSLFAIISALRSASVYRLDKSWTCLSKKERQQFDKLAEVFSDDENWSNLRGHIESLKLPCIPYLGLYLTDLVYIDVAHPHSGGLESQQRSLKMNNILRIISNYQTSNYSHLTCSPHVQSYLNSIRYIEELQKFVEDDQYKLSLKLEPPSASSSSTYVSKDSGGISSIDAAAIASLNLSPAKASNGSLRLSTATVSKYIPGHRKCSSLGANIFGRSNQAAATFDGKQVSGSKERNLLDDSELESSRQVRRASVESDVSSKTVGATKVGSDECVPLTTDESPVSDERQSCIMQGCVRRKTILKDGRRPAVASWQRYWIQIWASSLAYFSPKTFKGSQRSDFKREPSKLVSLTGCVVLLGSENVSRGSDLPNSDLFHIVDHRRGNVYKFKAGNHGAAMKWFRCLREAANADDNVPALPANLMSFD